MVVMKKIMFNYAAAVAATVFAVSCVNGQIEPTEEPSYGEVEGIEFVAHSEPVSKSALNGLSPVWVAGDEITVFGADGNGVACTYVGNNTFKGKVNASDKYYAVYPASSDNILTAGVLTAEIPAEQILIEGQNVAPGALVSFAASDDENLYFRNATGLIKLNIGRSDIASVVLTSTADGEYLAGKFTVNPSSETPSIELIDGTGASTITLLPSGEAFEAGEYYITTLPVTVSGIKVTFKNTKGSTVDINKASETSILRNSGIDLGQFFVYEIGTANELLAWNKANSKWTSWDVVKLTDNIDMSSIDDQWVIREFTGEFDGNGKTLSNAVLGGTSASNVGLFSPVDGIVKNLVIDGFTVTSGSADALALSAVISGGRMYGKIQGCVVKNSSVTLSNTSSGSYGGIISARMSNKAEVSGCNIQKCTLSVAKEHTGGVCGMIDGSSAKIQDCIITNSVISGRNCVGGVVGAATAGLINDCIVENTSVSANTNHAGGLVGQITGGVAINNISSANTITSSATAKGYYAGGLAGQMTNGSLINNISKDCLVSNGVSAVKDQFIALVVGTDNANSTGYCKNNVVISGSLKYGSATTVARVGIISGTRATNSVYAGNYYNVKLVENADVTGRGMKILPLSGPVENYETSSLTLGGSNPIGEGYTPELTNLHTTLNANIDNGLSATYPDIRKWQAVPGDWPTFVTE